MGELDKKRKDGVDKITDASDKDTSWGASFSWLQNGGCRPIDLGTLPLGAGIPIRLDICMIVPYVNAILNFLWAVGTFLAVVSMVFRVTTRAEG